MSQVANSDGRIVMHPYQATIPGLTLLTNITLQQTIDEDPDLVNSYNTAMTEALDWASENEDAVRAAISTNMNIPAEAVANITLPRFTAELDTAAIEELADLAVGYGVLPEKPDFATLIRTS